jgi:tRNA modification GTPase
MFEDTIIAISTPPGYGGLGVVRLSGQDALRIAQSFFRPRSSQKTIPPRRPVLGKIYHPQEKCFFEEALLTYFPAPKTYTREDVVEISCHGSPLLLEEIVRLGIVAGARLARPGEFTLRAYLNGRLDILQAEAVLDLIKASSLQQARISFQQLEGSLSKTFRAVRQELIELISLLETNIEFPEEEVKITPTHIEKVLVSLINHLQSLIQSYALGKTFTEGLRLAIIGRANVGKSTLFNALCGEERAIVTHLPGTTRDYLEERILIKNSVFRVVDTAGLSNASHPAEKEGIKRSQERAQKAEGLLLVIDSSEKLTEEDRRLLHLFREKPKLIILNKIDRPVKTSPQDIQEEIPDSEIVSISALQGTNLTQLKERIHEIFVPQQDFGQEVILHQRQKVLLEQIKEGLERTRLLLKENQSEELLAEEIRQVFPAINELLGEVRTEEILENIFNQFCIGK